MLCSGIFGNFSISLCSINCLYFGVKVAFVKLTSVWQRCKAAKKRRIRWNIRRIRWNIRVIIRFYPKNCCCCNIWWLWYYHHYRSFIKMIKYGFCVKEYSGHASVESFESICLNVVDKFCSSNDLSITMIKCSIHWQRFELRAGQMVWVTISNTYLLMTTFLE